jgi:hypothetical protein
MKKNMLLIVLMVFFLACETGTRYDEQTTTQTLPRSGPKSGLVDRVDIEALLDEKEEVFEEPYDDTRSWVVKEEIKENTEIEEKINSFSSGAISDGLDVKQIREGRHDGYMRLVFDVYDSAKPAREVGRYDAKYSDSKKDIVVVLQGYRKFSAPLPSFPSHSVIEQIHFDQYPDDSGFKFHIKLRENAKVRIFDLKNPARIVFDIKSI